MNSTNDLKLSNESDQIQNESPMNITSTIDNTTAPFDPANLSEVTTSAIEVSIEDSTEPITEKQLKFKPVQKKTGDRFKQMTR